MKHWSAVAIAAFAASFVVVIAASGAGCTVFLGGSQACDVDGDCPAGQVCGADKFCKAGDGLVGEGEGEGEEGEGEEGEGEGEEGEGEGEEGEGEPVACEPGCDATGRAEILCNAAGQPITLPCADDETCDEASGVCTLDPNLAGNGTGCTCSDARGGIWVIAAMLGLLGVRLRIRKRW